MNQVDARELIKQTCSELASMLCEKNRKYGNSALEPVRVFSKSDPDEQINVRLDDKLSRIRQGAADDDEDPLWDLMGYLILKIVQKRMKQTNGRGQHARNEDTIRGVQ